jgi:hypothetical protein
MAQHKQELRIPRSSRIEKKKSPAYGQAPYGPISQTSKYAQGVGCGIVSGMVSKLQRGAVDSPTEV